MSLCSKCLHIQFSVPGSWIEEGPFRSTLDIYFRNLLTTEVFNRTLFYIHHANLRELLDSSNEGCHGCTLIWHFVFAPSKETLSLDAKHPVILFYSLFPDEDGFLRWIPRNGSTLRIARDGKEFPSLRFLTLTDRTTGILQNSIAGSRSQTPSFDLAKQWVADCLILDPQCFQQSTPPMPDRLIDVGPPDGSQSPRLVLAKDYQVAARYLTLSHCWGHAPHFQTTSKNIEQHLMGLPLSSLPKTFQDAICVTRAFGVRYLWIDSLCIIQDSSHDWEHHSKAMGEIYSNAFFTIAASRSRDSHGGLFVDLDPKILTPCYLPSLTFSPTGRTHIINLLKDERTMTDSPKGPLYDRAWVLQEEILSRATLAFTDDGMYFLCCGCTTNVADPEGGRRRYEQLQPALPLRNYIMPYHSLLRARPEADEFNLLTGSETHSAYLLKNPYSLRVDDKQREMIYQSWTTMIEIFYRRQITYPTDRLPALAGIIPNLQSTLYNRATKKNSFYVGGLWTEDIERSLLWTVQSDQWLREHLNDNAIYNKAPGAEARRRSKPPCAYMAPSFSWASMHECPITWNGLNSRDWKAGPEAMTWIQFVSYTISAQNNWNVRLNYGSITIQCYLKGVEVIQGQLLHDLSRNRVRIGRCVFDDESDAVRFSGRKDEVWLLPLRNEPVIKVEEINIYCLMLSNTGHDPGNASEEGIQCRRLGLAYVKYPNWFGGSYPVTVELV